MGIGKQDCVLLCQVTEVPPWGFFLCCVTSGKFASICPSVKRDGTVFLSHSRRCPLNETIRKSAWNEAWEVSALGEWQLLFVLLCPLVCTFKAVSFRFPHSGASLPLAVEW